MGSWGWRQHRCLLHVSGRVLLCSVCLSVIHWHFFPRLCQVSRPANLLCRLCHPSHALRLSSVPGLVCTRHHPGHLPPSLLLPALPPHLGRPPHHRRHPNSQQTRANAPGLLQPWACLQSPAARQLQLSCSLQMQNLMRQLGTHRSLLGPLPAWRSQRAVMAAAAMQTMSTRLPHRTSLAVGSLWCIMAASKAMLMAEALMTLLMKVINLMAGRWRWLFSVKQAARCMYVGREQAAVAQQRIAPFARCSCGAALAICKPIQIVDQLMTCLRYILVECRAG